MRPEVLRRHEDSVTVVASNTHWHSNSFEMKCDGDKLPDQHIPTTAATFTRWD